MLDATALLWRLYLHGVECGERWAMLAAAWEEKAAVENGYYAFNDVHAMMAYVADGRVKRHGSCSPTWSGRPTALARHQRHDAPRGRTAAVPGPGRRRRCARLP
ncbi:MAG TPA: hypothetical protein VNN09_05665 [Candidatus Competibacteraceae bacterium]|nr:hypothetical protein [Candidatus Competibacteraceae bacterium]